MDAATGDGALLRRLFLGAYSKGALGVGTLAPLGSLVIAYWRVKQFDTSLPFARAAGLLALAFACGARWLMRQDASDAARLGNGQRRVSARLEACQAAFRSP